MKPHTSDFKNAIKQMGRELRGVITYEGTTLEEEIMSITPHYEANILKSVMKQLDLELSVDIPLETVINCQIGILVDEEYEMLNFGNYVVYSSEKQEDTNTYKIVCYDKLLYSMKQNEDLGVTYPISIKNYLTALATKIGLTVASGTFYNQDLQIPSELYVGLEYTYRDILDEIAQATGSIITLNNNDEIEVRYPNDLGSTATVNGTNLTIAEHSNNIIVNAIISGNSIQDGTPTPTNPVEIETAGDQINYFNKDTILAGHLINSNGTITEDNYNFVSDYIEVDSDREYTISAVTNKAKRIAYYNDSQTFISRPVISNYSGTVTTPSNAKYVRLSCHNDDLNSLQFYNTIGEIPLTISNSDNTQSQDFTIPCQQPMRSIGNVRDVFVKQDGLWYEKHNIGVIESYNGETITTNYMSTTGELSTGAFVQYVLGTPNYIQCTDEQIQVLNAISHSSLYTGVTNINSDAYLSITYNSASESIDEEYLKDVNVDFAEMYGPVNSIVLSRAGGSDNVYIQDEESVQENGLCEVKIADNQLMNFNNRSDYLTGLLAALDGLSYYKNDFNSTGILYYEVGDMYYVTIGENAYKCLMLNDEITVTTGIKERIYTDLPEQSQTDYSKADKTDRRINQTYLIIDKQNQIIESKVGEDEIISKINQTPEAITINANKLGISANDVLNILAGNTLNLTSKNISITSNNFSVDASGNATMNNANITGGEIYIDKLNSGTNPAITVDATNWQSSVKIYGDKIEVYNANDPAHPYNLEIMGDGIYRNGNEYFVMKGLVEDYTPLLDNSFNQLQDSGFYYVGGNSVSNAPSGFTTWYMVLVVKISNTFIFQYAYSPSTGQIAIRTYSGGTPTWSEWKFINSSKDAITIGLNADNSYTATSAYQTQEVSLTKQMAKSGSRLSLSNGKVTIGAGVSKVLVSGSMQTQGDNTTYGLNIYKTNTLVAQSFVAPSGSSYNHISIAPTLVSVSQGDTIRMGVYINNSGATKSLKAYNGTGTYLTVEVIE